MKTRKLIPMAFVLLLAFCWGSACTPEPIDLNVNDTDNIQSESASDGLFSDSEDLSSVTVSADNATGREALSSRVIVVNDPRLACATVTIVPDATSTLKVPIGLLTIDFGSGCLDKHGNMRKGKIEIAYHGRRFLPGSTVVTTLIGYEINGVKIEGTRSVTNASNSSQVYPRFTTTMTGGQITWPDASTVLRDETITREWILGATPQTNKWLVTGTATGKNRRDLQYAMNITQALEYDKSCTTSNIPVKGTKEIVVGTKKISIDYGHGACDVLVTITVKSKSRTLSLNI